MGKLTIYDGEERLWEGFVGVNSDWQWDLGQLVTELWKRLEKPNDKFIFIYEETNES